MFVSPAVMSPPASSPDLREERLAVGLMVKPILDRGRDNRQPQDFITVPLNEPIPMPEDLQDAIPVEEHTLTVPVRLPASNYRQQSACRILVIDILCI